MVKKAVKDRAIKRVTNIRKKSRAKKANNIKTNLFKDALSYLKETLNFVYIIVALFFISALIAFSFPEQFTFFDEVLKGIIDEIEGLNFFELIWFIFQNNVSSAFFAMILGIFLGIAPIVNALLNGSILGYVYFLASSQEGFWVIRLLLPHGIFELPAVFIALGLGAKWGMFMFAGKGKRRIEFVRRFFGSIKVFLTIVLPLLIIAAIIEGLLIVAGG